MNKKYKDATKESINNRASQYKDAENLWSKIEGHIIKIKLLFSNEKIRDFIFEPIKKVFHIDKNLEDADIYAIITQIAVANAVMAGLPGKMGVGVFVSLALEVWMAYSIAKMIGIDVKSPKDVLKYFSVIAGSILMVLEGFRMLLGLAFSLFSIIPFLNPMIFAELFVTNLVGVILWVGFKEAKETGSFTIPKRLIMSAMNKAKKLTNFQWTILKGLLNPDNLKAIQKKILSWFKGDVVIKTTTITDEIFTGLAMANLLNNTFDNLEGPVGKEFLSAIRDRFPDLKTASIEEISSHMRNYDESQIQGALQSIKGRLFERLIALSENTDNDDWVCRIHENQFNPSTDLIMINQETNEMLDLSLKATDSVSYIEASLARYPNDTILITSELGDKFVDDPRVLVSSFSNEYMIEVTEENFEELLNHMDFIEINQSAISTGTAISTTLSIWPFLAAYKRNKITQEQLKKAFVKVLGDSGLNLFSKIIKAMAMGPLYPWYILAKMSMNTTKMASIN